MSLNIEVRHPRFRVVTPLEAEDESAACRGVIGLLEHTANITWGDDDLRSLYITASTWLYRLRVRVPGWRLF